MIQSTSLHIIKHKPHSIDNANMKIVAYFVLTESQEISPHTNSFRYTCIKQIYNTKSLHYPH